MINATNWKELKKELKQIQGKAVFKLERVNSMNDGTFYRVLHTETENKIVYFENGFRIGNCTYILDRIMEV